jgi:hypothetical protein
MSDDDQTIREPDALRRDAARKLARVEVSAKFKAILACLVGESWTTPRLVEMQIAHGGHLLGRAEGQIGFDVFLGDEQDLLRNIHGVAAVAELDGDEVGYLVAKVAEMKRQQ